MSKQELSDANDTSPPPREPPSDVWATALPATYDHMASVARDARNLLGALNANVQWLRSAAGDEMPSGQFLDGLSDIETCCERLNNMLEDALLGARPDGFRIRRSTLSFESVLASAIKQVTKRAEAKGIAFRITTELDVVAKLDRSLITRAMVKLLSTTISDSAAKAEIAVTYVLERGVVTVTFVRIGTFLSGPPLSPVEPSSWGTAEHERDSALAFSRAIVEGHGGTLTVGSGSTLYRIDLPWLSG